MSISGETRRRNLPPALERRQKVHRRLVISDGAEHARDDDLRPAIGAETLTRGLLHVPLAAGRVHDDDAWVDAVRPWPEECEGGVRIRCLTAAPRTVEQICRRWIHRLLPQTGERLPGRPRDDRLTRGKEPDEHERRGEQQAVEERDAKPGDHAIETGKGDAARWWR
jgi:hypothetical protein